MQRTERAAVALVGDVGSVTPPVICFVEKVIELVGCLCFFNKKARKECVINE